MPTLAEMNMGLEKLSIGQGNPNLKWARIRFAESAL